MLLPALFALLQVPAQVPVPAPAVQAPVKVATPDPLPPARIELTTPFPAHLGSIGPRESREAVYGIKSLHDRPFTFRLLDLSLGLTFDTAQIAAPMQPGEVRMVKVKVNATGLFGFIKGAMRLGTDDPAQPNYILRYDMTVRPEVAVDAERKSLGEVAAHESPEIRFRFRREGGDPLKVALASQLPAHLEGELVPEGADTVDLRLVLRPAHLKPGVTAGLEILKVTTNGPRQPEFTLYADWRLLLPVVPTPSRLVFSDLRTTLQALELTSRDGQPFKILKAEIQGKGFTLLDTPSQASERHLLRVRRTGKTPEALLLLTCSNLEEPLQVPLRFLDPKARPPKGAQPQPVPEPEHHHRH
jgi:hypothetical protein